VTETRIPKAIQIRCSTPFRMRSGLDQLRNKTDEYEPKVGTILPRLKPCHLGETFTTLYMRNFVAGSAASAGASEVYRKSATEI
jgi:hypothetical protein